MPLSAPLRLSLPVVTLALLSAALGGSGGLAADAAAWRTRLTAGDADEQFTAIQSAASSKDPQAALPLLEAGVLARYPHLAIACGEALRALGTAPAADAEVQKTINAGLKAKEDERQRNLARVLCAWGAPELDASLAALAGGRRAPEVQAEALFLLGLLDARDEKAFPLVRDMLVTALEKGRTPEIRMAACSSAGVLGLAKAREALASLARRGSDKYVGLFAVHALRRIGWNEGLSSFLHVLGQTPKDDARNACLKALVELSTPTDIPELLSLTRSSKKDYRDAAALALGRLAWQGREAQAAKPVTPGDPAAPPSPPAPPEIVDRLIDMVADDTEWEVRDAARTALLRIGEPAAEKARERLPALIEFSDADVAQTAMELCGLFKAPDARRALVKTAVYEDPKDRTRRMYAARALEGVDPEGAVKELVERVRPRPKARPDELFAVRALGYIRHKASFDALVAMLSTEGCSDELLREVEFALERLTGHRFGRERPSVWTAWYAGSKSPLHTRQKALNRAANRRNASEKGLYGLTKETERCVENGLRFLELNQHATGEWDGNEKGFGGVIGCQPAYTGLSLLAFLGAGYVHTGGKYRETVRRATEFLMATQFYDGSYPVTGGGDESWIYAYLISMGVWGMTEAYAMSLGGAEQPHGDPMLRRCAQAGVDYLQRVQTPGGGWRYGPRMVQSDSSCTSWVLMTLKTADLAGLDVPQKSLDGIDSWFERCSFDITGETETPSDLASDYDYEVGSRRRFKAFMGYFELSGKEASALQQTSMTAVGMVCRFFMGFKRSHPFQIGCANYLLAEYLPQWMAGLNKGMAIAWYHYYWYYGTLAMYQMGGKYWRAWNERIRRMYPEKQRVSPPELAGSWDPDTALLNGGRLFSTAMSVLTLESYYRFSPLLGDEAPPPDAGDGAEKKVPPPSPGEAPK